MPYCRLQPGTGLPLLHPSSGYQSITVPRGMSLMSTWLPTYGCVPIGRTTKPAACPAVMLPRSRQPPALRSHVTGTWPTLHDSLKPGKYSCFEYGEILLRLSKSKSQILREGYGTNQPRRETVSEWWYRTERERSDTCMSTISGQLMFPWWWLLLYPAFLETVTRWHAHAYRSTWQEVEWRHRPYLSFGYYAVPSFRGWRAKEQQHITELAPV